MLRLLCGSGGSSSGDTGLPQPCWGPHSPPRDPNPASSQQLLSPKPPLSDVPALVLKNTTLKFLLFKSIPGHGDIFEEVSERDLQPGDILLFPLESSSEKVNNVFKHAAVYCGDEEVIHFLGTSTTSTLDLISSRRFRGEIVKSGYNTLKKDRGKCEIYRKKGGVNLNDLRNEIQKAMASEAEYSLYTNNCIHFALSLLGLQEFYSKLVEIQDEDGSCCGGAAI
ncbi:uncharacterized protein LOC135992585 [Caloenas nicobarica]|uniref:uncharacterized protein LOC135992585 n=1 Tax=Caloenas nicobarica TaxID=187106 RepID=UPI0032B80624